MERLTKYDEFGNAEFVGIDNTKLYERLVCDETVALTIATNKLAKLEDVLEEFELTSAEDLRNDLNFKGNMAIWERELNYKNKIADLERELAELKQKAIVPKFKVGQKIFFIDTNFQIEQGVIYQIRMFQMDSSEWGNHLIDLGQEYEDDIRFIYEDEEEIFVTKEEAEQKLAEINGE